MPTEKTELRESGYQDLRDAADPTAPSPDPWAYVELRDDEDEPITRLEIEVDERAGWVHTGSSQYLRAEIEIAATDDDIQADDENPVTIVGTASYAVADAGEEKGFDETHPITLAHESDEVVVTHTIEIPEVI